MVGKTLKSKINGSLFFVEELKSESVFGQYYIIRDMATGQKFASSKGWFEHGIMQNLEIID